MCFNTHIKLIPDVISSVYRLIHMCNIWILTPHVNATLIYHRFCADKNKRLPFFRGGGGTQVYIELSVNCQRIKSVFFHFMRQKKH